MSSEIGRWLSTLCTIPSVCTQVLSSLPENRSSKATDAGCGMGDEEMRSAQAPEMTGAN